MLENRMYSLNQYLRDTFSEKVYRLSFDPGTTCPNRDGTLGYGGCIFCSEGGSGDFTPRHTLPISEQLAKAKALVASKGATKYLGYSQAFTGTYGDPQVLEERFGQVLSEPDIVGLSIGTRPDCLPQKMLDMLLRLRERYQKPIWIELGLQTTNDALAKQLHRGYDYTVFSDAVNRLHALHFPIIVHLILGLPTETEEDMLASLRTVCALPIDGIKLSLLYVLRGTEMEKWYRETPEDFHLMEEEAYYQFLCRALCHIPKHIVVHRITGDAPKPLLVAPLWTGNKKRVLNTITARMKETDSYQGRDLE